MGSEAETGTNLLFLVKRAQEPAPAALPYATILTALLMRPMALMSRDRGGWE